MPILSRLKYAICVLIAVTMVLMLTLGIGEGMGMAYPFDTQGLAANPFYFVPVFVAGFVVAPALADRLPVSGDLPISGENGKASYGYTARTLLLVVGGLVLAALLNLGLFLVGKLT